MARLRYHAAATTKQTGVGGLKVAHGAFDFPDTLFIIFFFLLAIY